MAKRTKTVIIDPIESLPYSDSGLSDEIIVDTVMEEEIDKVDLQKQKFLEYIESNKDHINTVVSNYSNVYAGMNNLMLQDLAYTPDFSPLSHTFGVADAFIFELKKRKMKKELEHFQKRLESQEWYTTPWAGF